MKDQEAVRIYSLHRSRALRAGHTREVAATIARDAVRSVTGLSIAGRRNRVPGPVAKEAPAAFRRDAGIPQPQSVRIPPDVLAEAERIKDLNPSSLTGYLMGDPLPGRSAFDRRG